MPTPQEQRIAEENRLQRAVQRALAPAPQPELPGFAQLGERVAAHESVTTLPVRAMAAPQQAVA